MFLRPWLQLKTTRFNLVPIIRFKLSSSICQTTFLDIKDIILCDSHVHMHGLLKIRDADVHLYPITDVHLYPKQESIFRWTRAINLLKKDYIFIPINKRYIIKKP